MGRVGLEPTTIELLVIHSLYLFSPSNSMSVFRLLGLNFYKTNEVKFVAAPNGKPQNAQRIDLLIIEINMLG